LYALALAERLAESKGDPESALADIAFSFQVGRPALPHRLAIVAGSLTELRKRLDAFVASGTGGPGCWTGEAGSKPAPGAAAADVGSPPPQGDLAELARRWVAGAAIDWTTLHGAGQARRRHGLPTYPFARERYWVPQPEGDT